MAKYTVIHGNVIYKVENATYTTNEKYRIFKKNDKVILSIPLSSVFIKDDEGVTAKIVSNLISGIGISETNKTIIKESTDDFTEGVIIGGIVGATLF